MNYILKAFLVVGLFIGVIFGYANEVDSFSNTFNVRSLLFSAMGIGLIWGLLGAKYFDKDKTEEYEKMRHWASWIVAGLTMTPLFALSANHRLADWRGVTQNVPVQYMGATAIRLSRFGLTKGTNSSLDGYYIYLIKDGKKERVRSTSTVFKDIEVGTMVELPIRKGLLGFDFVDYN